MGCGSSSGSNREKTATAGRSEQLPAAHAEIEASDGPSRAKYSDPADPPPPTPVNAAVGDAGDERRKSAELTGTLPVVMDFDEDDGCAPGCSSPEVFPVRVLQEVPLGMEMFEGDRILYCLRGDVVPRICDVNGRREEVERPMFTSGPIVTLCVFAKGSACATAGCDSTIIVWTRRSETTGGRVACFRRFLQTGVENPLSLSLVAGSQDGSIIAAATAFSLKARSVEEDLEEVREDVSSSAPSSPSSFDRSSRVCSEKASVWVWFTPGSQYRRFDSLHDSELTVLSITLDNTCVVTGCRGGDILVCDALTGVARHKYEMHNSSVQDVSFSPSDSIMATTDRGNVYLCDTRSGGTLFSLTAGVLGVVGIKGATFVTGRHLLVLPLSARYLLVVDVYTGHRRSLPLTSVPASFSRAQGTACLVTLRTAQLLVFNFRNLLVF